MSDNSEQQSQEQLEPNLSSSSNPSELPIDDLEVPSVLAHSPVDPQTENASASSEDREVENALASSNDSHVENASTSPNDTHAENTLTSSNDTDAVNASASSNDPLAENAHILPIDSSLSPNDAQGTAPAERRSLMSPEMAAMYGLQRVSRNADEAINADVNQLSSDDADEDSSLSDMDEPPRWMHRDPRVHQAIEELLLQSRRVNEGENNAAGRGDGTDGGGPAGSGFGDNFFLQRLRRVVFNLNNDEEMDTAQDQVERDIPITFDTNLSAEHAYMGGDMNSVSGVNYLETGKTYNLLLFVHQHVLFPGELLPFIDYGAISETDIDATEGFLFGVCFPNLRGRNDSDDTLYGVTCQLFEKGIDASGNMRIKSRVLQRFVGSHKLLKGPIGHIGSHYNFKCYGAVRILPEINLPEPLDCLRMGSMQRFRDSKHFESIYRRFQECSSPLPSYVYDNYDLKSIIEQARAKLENHKIDTMPTDRVQLSFWLVRNLHLPEAVMKDVFLSDCVNIRMKLIANSFTEDLIYICRYCGNRIAKCADLFAMSKYGVQTQYCNPAGHIHETNTVYQVLRNAISFSGEPSAEFSWFPGYKWQIVICKLCSRHIGWQFKANETTLVPRSFYGISSSSVRVTASQSQNDLNSPLGRNYSPTILYYNDRADI